MTKRDISKRPPIDLYVCGFPCQPFTIMNQVNRQDEKSDHPTHPTHSQKNIFTFVFKVLKTKKPKYFILENVKGLTQGKCLPYFEYILKKLNELKIYDIHHSILNTADYGIPQSRPRLYIVGVPKGSSFQFPKPSKRKTTFHSFLETNPTQPHPEYRLPSHKLKEVHPFKDHIIDLKFLLDSSPSFNGSSGSNRFKNTDTPCFLESSRGYYLTKHKRLLSAREMLNLHGFSRKFVIPKHISESRMRRFAGNTMSVNVLKAIMKNMFI